MLIAQVQAANLVLLSNEAVSDGYGIRLWQSTSVHESGPMTSPTTSRIRQLPATEVIVDPAPTPRLEGIAVLERPCPMVHGRLVDHGHRNRSNERWREVFDYAKKMGFSYLRGGVPWNKVWLAENTWDWSRLDAEFEYADRIGLTIVPILAHMSYAWESGWMRGPNGGHALERQDLAEFMVRYTRIFLERYRKHLRAGFIPIVEIGGEPYNHVITGLWEPHRTDDYEAQEQIIANLVKAFNASAAVAHEPEFGISVIACEARECLFTVIQLDADIFGTNFYAFAHQGESLADGLADWRKTFLEERGIDPTFAILEWGSPEYMDPDNHFEREPGTPPPGRSVNREKEDELLRSWLQECKARGIRLAFACRYLVGNFWHYHLTQSSEGLECDRNALIDVHWNAEIGDYEYYPCWELARKFQQIIEDYNQS